VVSDGAGGAIVTWQDYRSGAAYDIYAQRINGSGVVQWAKRWNLCQRRDRGPERFRGGAGWRPREFIAWVGRSHRSKHDDIYAQRIDGSGTSL